MLSFLMKIKLPHLYDKIVPCYFLVGSINSFTLARIYNPSLSNIRICNPQTYHTLFIMNYLMRIANPYIYMCRIANPTQRPALRTSPRTELDYETVIIDISLQQ